MSALLSLPRFTILISAYGPTQEVPLVPKMQQVKEMRRA